MEITKHNNTLILYKDGKVKETHQVATGSTRDKTPEGTFTLGVKIHSPGWKHIPGDTPQNPLGPRWLGIVKNSDRARVYGIHGTNNPSSIGKKASNGCIRMHNESAIKLANTIPEGTPVWIHNEPSSGIWNGDASYGVTAQKGKLKVTADHLHLLSGPTQGALEKSELNKGDVLEIEGYVKSWYQVKALDKVGFVHESKVTPIAEVAMQPLESQQLLEPTNGASANPRNIVIIMRKANIRNRPSMKSTIIMKREKNEVISCVGENTYWYHVQLESGELAYINKSVAKWCE